MDEFSLVAVAPPAGEGRVDVRVVTEAGESTLADVFSYVRPLVVTLVTPNRVPEVGGVEITIQGIGF